MSRLIDADAVVKWYWDEFVDKHGFSPQETRFSIRDIEMNLSNIPTAGKWIPVSERLPVDYTLNLVTFIDKDNDLPIVDIAFYRYKQFHNKDFGLLEVIAWQPLPKPYEVEEE